MRSLTHYTEESEGKPLDVDGRAVLGARNRNPFAVSAAENVESVFVDPGSDEVLERHVYESRGLFSLGTGTHTKVDCAVAVIDIE